MNELDVSLYSALTGGTALTALLSGTAAVYPMQAPVTAVYPYIVFNQQAGGETNQTQRDRREYLYQIACYTNTSIAAAWAIDAQVSARLKGVTLTVTGWTNSVTFRETDLPILETLTSGEIVYSVRTFYRIRLSK